MTGTQDTLPPRGAPSVSIHPSPEEATRRPELSGLAELPLQQLSVVGDRAEDPEASRVRDRGDDVAVVAERHDRGTPGPNGSQDLCALMLAPTRKCPEVIHNTD